MEVLQTAQYQETLSLQERTASVVNTLDEMFPEQERYSKEIKVAKQILGEIADEFTPEELKDLVTEIQFLCESWLDDFERTVFDGQTLKELLHDKGGR